MKKCILICIVLLSFISVVYAGEVFLSDGSFSFEWLGEKVAVKDAYGNDCSIILYNDTAYVPVRTIGNLVNEEVGFDAENKVVSVGSDVDTLNIASIEIEYKSFGFLYKKDIYDFTQNLHIAYIATDYYEDSIKEFRYPIPSANQKSFFEALKKTEFFNWEDSYLCEKDLIWENHEYITVKYADGTSRKMHFNGKQPPGYYDVVTAFYEIDSSRLTLGR